MRFITFNLRFENEGDGENAWSGRREMIIRIVRRYAPSVLGTQEGRWVQLRYLEEHLPEYAMQAPNRVTDDASQYPTLFVRKDAFDVLECEAFWLSRTPEAHLSKDWDSAFPRMMSAARLRHRSTGNVLWTVVTHLDHVGDEARYRQAKMVADWIALRRVPVVLMGDFNDVPGSRAHAVLTAEGTGLVDTWQSMGRREGERAFTHHGFEGVPQKTRMDWILASRSFEVESVRILRDQEEGRYPSDHFPYLADLSFPGEGRSAD
ncbi:MAG: endonuclease/exonuclease/phosphatase family protein [Deltaproteobacteria bacterium]|nr:endonuclease/exonuclease/phosphatase family protein [Deltaproteobacteria bacterium]